MILNMGTNMGILEELNIWTVPSRFYIFQNQTTPIIFAGKILMILEHQWEQQASPRKNSRGLSKSSLLVAASSRKTRRQWFT